MSASRHAATVVVALLLAGGGFASAALGSAWVARDRRAEPWRDLNVQHQGTAGATTRTLVSFASANVPLAGVEVVRGPDGKPERAHIEVRGGGLLDARYGEDRRPAEIAGPDGRKALLSYKGTNARVLFVGPKGESVGDKVLRVHIELRSALTLASVSSDWSLIGQAWAQTAPTNPAPAGEDKQVRVEREVSIALDVRLKSGKGGPGEARVEASCEPFTCLPVANRVAVPGQSTVRVGVSATTKQSALAGPAKSSALEPFKEMASAERATASEVLPDVGSAVAALGVTAQACAYLQLNWPVCVPALASKATVGGAAVNAITSHRVSTKGGVVDQRAKALYYEEQARASFDKPAKLRVCLSRKGYARACTVVDARPFAKQASAPVARSLELRASTGGALNGNFALTQGDGADCKFSSGPKTDGKIELRYDIKNAKVSANLSASGRGTRPRLRCSLGTADMRWTQSYSGDGQQAVSADKLQAGGKLPIRLVGTMRGTSSLGWSNCKSRGGTPANCPGGRTDNYNYPMEIIGEIDLDSGKGSGRILVRAPLSTNGSWTAAEAGSR